MARPSGVLIQKDTFSASFDLSSSPSSRSPLKPLAVNVKRMLGPPTAGVTLNAASAAALTLGATTRFSSEPASSASTPSQAMRLTRRAVAPLPIALRAQAAPKRLMIDRVLIPMYLLKAIMKCRSLMDHCTEVQFFGRGVHLHDSPNTAACHLPHGRL